QDCRDFPDDGAVCTNLVRNASRHYNERVDGRAGHASTPRQRNVSSKVSPEEDSTSTVPSALIERTTYLSRSTVSPTFTMTTLLLTDNTALRTIVPSTSFATIASSFGNTRGGGGGGSTTSGAGVVIAGEIGSAFVPKRNGLRSGGGKF